MADPILEPEDLTPFAEIDPDKAREMIADAEAMAALAAPCITDPDFRNDGGLVAALKALLRQSILRRNDTGSGAISQIGSGPFQMSTDTRTPTRGLFWPSEIAQLRDLCSAFREEDQDKAFSVNMIPESPPSLASRPDLWFQHIQPTPPGAP